MKNKTLNIIIPIYNEKNTINIILEKIEKVKLFSGFSKNIIIVDDNSNDGTKKLLKKYEDKYKIINNNKNHGKGYSIRKGLQFASGKYTIIQDGDLEYNPENYNDLLREIITKEISVIYGSRILNKSNDYSHLSFLYGGKILTYITNLLYNQKLTDEPTCYKLFNTLLLKKLDLESNGFEFCPEVTAKVSRLGYKIKEIPIDYFPRKKKEGKKIRYKDGLIAIYTLFKYVKWNNNQGKN